MKKEKICVKCMKPFEGHHAAKYCPVCKEAKVAKEVVATPAVEAKVEKPDTKRPAPFLEVQTLAAVSRSVLDVYNKNPNYAFMWQRKVSMQGANRCGIWHTVNKTHPDFEGMYVEQDDTPKESFFSTGDLVLACCRKETYLAAKNRQKEYIKRRADGFEARHKNALDRISKEGIKVSDKTFNEMDSLIADYSPKK